MSVESQIISPEQTDDELLVVYLRTHHATCPVCKYDLHQLTQPRCPECGRMLSLNVNVVEPYLRVWIATTMLAFSNAGVGMLFVIMLLRTLLIRGGFGHTPALFWLLVAYYIGAIPASLCLLWQRARFVKLSRSLQRGFLVCTATLTVTVLALILVLAG